MNRIHRLEQSVIDQIAAGEIIERPASVVKELVENSIDAGATEITVELEQGGRALIRVSDNGSGIHPDDLPLAALAHATSKIDGPEDLFTVTSLGFRGEALASISSVSELSISSRPPGLQAGKRIECSFGRLTGDRQIGMAVGTIVEVKDLFRNLPARLKFLRSASTEVQYCSEMITRFALAYPSIGFRLRSGTRTTRYAAAPGDLRRRIRECLGEDVASSLIELEYEDPTVGLVSGFISAPPAARGNSKLQYTFLNGRYIRDKSIQSAITEAYRGRLVTGQHPMVFLSLVVPPERFDVNVHPTKTEVRFIESHKIFSFILIACMRALESKKGPLEAPPITGPGTSSEVEESVKRAILGHYQRGAGSKPSEFAASGQGGRTTARLSGDRLFTFREILGGWDASFASEPTEPLFIDGWRYIGSYSNTYLFFEVDGDLVVIDQHALHERLLFEQFSGKASIASQRLLIPQSIELSSSEFTLWEQCAQHLKNAGFDVEPFGERTIAVHAVPEGFPVQSCAEVLQRSISECAGEQEREPSKVLETMACKAAIKAGDKLSPAEVRELVRGFLASDESKATCPHGRPAVIRFNLSSVKKWFKRT
ncbi:MAG: DNA mismatch repair endonuclease MutL [Planctomycetota bacterium]